MKAAKIYLEKSFEVAVPVAALWDIVTQTARINREMGLAPVRYKFVEGEDGLHAEVRFMGRDLKIFEKPYNWIRHERLEVERHYDGSPVRSTRSGVRFTPLNSERTQVTIFSHIEPRHAFGAWISRTLFKRRSSVRQEALYRQLEQKYAVRAPQLLPPPPDIAVNTNRLEQLLTRLRATAGLDTFALEKLGESIRHAHDDELSRMRPYVWADKMSVSRPEAVRLFLHATRAGLLDMSWSVLCPNCRVASPQTTLTRLTELSKVSHCGTCQIDFDASFDQFVELRFSPSPSVREVMSEQYCLSGPFMTPHVLAQVSVPPGTTAEFSLPVGEGFYRLRTRPRTVALNIFNRHGHSQQNIELSLGGQEKLIKQETVADRLNFKLTNPTESEMLVIFEQGAWGSQGLSAAEVTTLQDFRDLFGAEVLSPGLTIEIKNLTFLFSDLKDSTALYERTGDSSAYALVRDHFAVMGDAIARRQGAIVKTIGDAVMAVFTDPARAIAASLEIQAGIAELNAAHPEREPLIIKLGLHAGPCIAITANDILDYFGSTVNTAARVQGVSAGHDLVITEEVYNAPGVAEQLAQLRHEQFEMKLKGLSQNFRLYRFLFDATTPDASLVQTSFTGSQNPRL
jgi:adenylate cyclase